MLDYPVRRRLPDAGRLTVGAAWLDSLSLAPRAASGSVRASTSRWASGPPKARRSGSGCRRHVLPLSPQPQPLEVPAGVRAFDRDTARLRTPVVRDRYVGLLRGRALGPDPGMLRCDVACPRTAPVRSRRYPASTRPRARASATASGPWSRRSSAPIPRAHAGRCRWRVLDTLPVVAELTTTRRRARHHRQPDGRARASRAGPTPGSSRPAPAPR